MLEAKPSPRENPARIENSAPPEKPRTLRSVRTGSPKRPTLRPTPTSAASEAEKQLSKIRAKLTDKQAILEHPEALIDAWEALRNFHNPKNQPDESELKDLRDTLQKALYEYQARTEKIQTLRLSKTLKVEKKQEFEGQREQLEKILSELMGSDNPSQAKQDSAGAFNEFASWREQQKRAAISKKIGDYNQQDDQLQEREFALREEIEAATGNAIMGNTAEEIKNNLKISPWKKIKDYLAVMAGKKPIMQLIGELESVQAQRVSIQHKLNELESFSQSEKATSSAVRAERVRGTKVVDMTEAQGMKDFGLEDLNQVESHASIDQTEQLTAEDMIDEVPAKTKVGRNTIKDQTTDQILQEIEEQADKNAREEEVPEMLTEKDIIETRQAADLKNQLKLLKQAHQEMLEELGMETSTRQDKKSDARNLKAIRQYEQQISELEEKIEKISVSDDNLEELIPEDIISSQAPPPPSEAEREKRLDLQAAIAGRPRKNRAKPRTLKKPRTVEDDEELFAQTQTILESAGQAAKKTAPAEQFNIPKKQTLRRPKPSVIIPLEGYPVSEKLPTARSTKELPQAYSELQQLINDRLGLLPKEDRLALNFDSKTYAEKALNRDRAYAAGNDKEGEAYQVSIDQLNKVLNQAGVVGDMEDLSMHSGGKSKGLKVLGGDFLTKNSDLYTKVIPTARRSRELKHPQHLETVEAPTLSVSWAQAHLGESASDTWKRVAPIIAERNLGPAVSKRLESLMQEAGHLNLKGTSIDYQALPELLNKVRADSAYTSSPEASAYVLLKAFKPKNEQDKKIQPLIDRAIKAIDAQMLDIKPVAENFIQKSEVSRKARQGRQSLRAFDLLKSQTADKPRVSLRGVTEQFKQKNKAKTIDRSISELAQADKRQETISRESNNKFLSQEDRLRLLAKAGAKNAKQFAMLLDDYLRSLDLKNESTVLAQQRLRKEAIALGLNKDKTIIKLLSRYKEEAPKASKKPRTARTKRTAR